MTDDEPTELEKYLLITDEPKYLDEFYRLRNNNIDYVRIVKQFQKLLGVYTTTEALAKVAVLMREETESERLLSKALGYLQTCSDAASKILYKEILNAFGITDD